MTSPHSPYPPHSGHAPGPSSYYPPPHLYGAHSPGPGANYPYQYPPPHMNAPPAARPGRGGSYAARNPYNYYVPPQYGHPGAVPLHAPNPHAHPYSPAKFNHHGHHQHHPYPHVPQPFYPNPAAIPFTPPSRLTPQPTPPQTTQGPSQPLSPLPKQLSIPPPLTGFYEPPPVSSPVTLRPPGPEHEKPQTAPPPEKEAYPSPASSVHAPEFLTTSSSQQTPLNQTPELLHTELAPNATPYEYASMGSIETSTSPKISSASHVPSTLATPSTPQSANAVLPSSVGSESTEDALSIQAGVIPNPVVLWAIWSRRPTDPSSAPGIIISPRARPPPGVVEQAIGERTPPGSPVPSKKLPELNAEVVPAISTSSGVPAAADVEAAPESPTSSQTPVDESASITAGSKEVELSSDAVAPEAIDVADDDATVESALSSAVESTPAASIAAPEPSTSAAPNALPAETTTPSAPTAPPVVPATPSAPPPKRSWASLLRPAEASPSTSSKNSLPTSNVVGFSIPASPSASSSVAPADTTGAIIGGVAVSAAKKTELINLLTGAVQAVQGAPTKIRPRGLVNNGNTCFANAVLQILVYCAPFGRLFMELGRLLPSASSTLAVSANSGFSSNDPLPGGKLPGSSKSSSPKPKSAPSASSTPLVDATAQFMREFVVRAKVASTPARGKGKERQEEEDEWEMDSFLPQYVYEAMRAGKRFDGMRGGQQEDAEEFLGFYLDTLEEELLSILHTISPPPSTAPPEAEERAESAKPEEGWMEVGKKNRMVVTRTVKATESPITRIFGGKFRSTLRAPRQNDSVVVEDWRSLRLDIQKEQIRTIQDALAHISHPQPVQVSLPTQPGVPVEATQQVLIETLPPILVLHMKRFCYDTTVGGVVKVGKQVAFGPELEIAPELMAPSVRKATGTRYKLFGVLYHHGLSASGGHYTLDVLHPTRYPGSTATKPTNPAEAAASAKAREGWIRIDDELVSDVRPDDVFRQAEKDDNSRCAYLLFYRRVSVW